MSSPPSTNCHVSLCYKAASSSVSLGHLLTPLQHQGGWFLPNPTNPWGMVGNVVPKARLQGAGQHCQPRMVLQGLEVKTNLLRQQLCLISHEISRHPQQRLPLELSWWCHTVPCSPAHPTTGTQRSAFPTSEGLCPASFVSFVPPQSY